MCKTFASSVTNLKCTPRFGYHEAQVHYTQSLSLWLQDLTYPNTTLSWNVIRGTGVITQKIFRSSSYYVALGNLEEEVKVELNLTVRAFLHNTTKAYYKCALTGSPCSMNIFFPHGSTAVLNTSNDEWYVKLTYGPRWLTYIIGIGSQPLSIISLRQY
ncbi:hypothetical protein MtrunA17_Chr7g0242491 [Medicago truncatula]|uniref:E3 ubiquitin-protein ligase APD1-4 middle domain-containing protein n=1 Tax=Medicago truncatula TaxID=3880 RepID=A0A396H419_MEDTR|nr:hypothetical protein MtrunA17_Chr7g0242491 [Medicago truncatula]